jgi:hypothetical protein
MTYAAIARSPVFGGRVKRVNDRKARAVSGVLDVFPISNGVAVIAKNTWAAFQGRNALEIAWDEGPNATSNASAPGGMQKVSFFPHMASNGCQISKRILKARSLFDRRKSERGQIGCNQVKSTCELRHQMPEIVRRVCEAVEQQENWLSLRTGLPVEDVHGPHADSRMADVWHTEHQSTGNRVQ